MKMDLQLCTFPNVSQTGEDHETIKEIHSFATYISNWKGPWAHENIFLYMLHLSQTGRKGP
jgi:hypothetical protein